MYIISERRGISEGDKEGVVSMRGKWVGRLRRWEWLLRRWEWLLNLLLLIIVKKWEELELKKVLKMCISVFFNMKFRKVGEKKIICRNNYC